MKIQVLITQIAAGWRAAHLYHGHGATDARTETFWLLAYVTGWSFDELAGRLSETLTTRQIARAQRLAARRAAERIPLAYLLGEAWLGPWRFVVDRRVIVPRSFIATLLFDQLHPWVRQPGRVRRVLDLCTGSGCLAIVAAHVFPNAQVDALDLSGRALQVARKNVALHGLTERIRLLRGDLLAPVPDERYDLILTNPPYVTDRAMARLPAEYHCEPSLALAGGHDGLDLVARIVEQAADHLTPRGLLVMETGHARARIEQRWPGLTLTWSELGGGTIVCVAARPELALNAGPSAQRPAASRPRALRVRAGTA